MTSRFWTRWKSAVSGRFVKAWWAVRHPRESYGTRIERQKTDGDRR